MQCSQCQHANRDTAKYCEECGARLIDHCVHCGHHVSSQAKFCEACGAALMAPALASRSIQPGQLETDKESRLQTMCLAVMQLLQREKLIAYRALKYRLGIECKGNRI